MSRLDFTPYRRSTVGFDHLFDLLENKVLPAYYDEPKEWDRVVLNSMNDVAPYFDSDRMADEYYGKMYA